MEYSQATKNRIDAIQTILALAVTILVSVIGYQYRHTLLDAEIRDARIKETEFKLVETRRDLDRSLERHATHKEEAKFWIDTIRGLDGRMDNIQAVAQGLVVWIANAKPGMDNDLKKRVTENSRDIIGLEKHCGAEHNQ